jgi:hypothetical protein
MRRRPVETIKLKLKCHNCNIPLNKSEPRQWKSEIGGKLVTWEEIGHCPKCEYKHGVAVKTEEITEEQNVDKRDHVIGEHLSP